MKLKSFLFLLFIGLFTSVNSKVDGFREIDLLGELDPTDARSIVLPSVTAEQSDNAVIVNFAKTLGVVNITVSTGDEVVYSTVLNVSAADQFVIYTGEFKSDAYLLEFTRATNGGRAYGNFVIE